MQNRVSTNLRVAAYGPEAAVRATLLIPRGFDQRLTIDTLAPRFGSERWCTARHVANRGQGFLRCVHLIIEIVARSSALWLVSSQLSWRSAPRLHQAK